MEQRVSAWKNLKSLLSKVSDTVLYNAMIVEFRKRALRDWGFDPETGDISTQSSVVLDEWEKEFVNDIRDTEKYQIDTRVGKQEKTAHETRVRMMDFVSQGGKLADIPDDVRSDTIDRLYYECLLSYGDQVCAEADAFIVGSAK